MKVTLSQVNGRQVYALLDAKKDRVLMTIGWEYADGSGEKNEPIPLTKNMCGDFAHALSESADKIGDLQ